MNETIKDILCMLWGFFGGGICFFLIWNAKFRYITGSFLSVGEIISNTFYFVGFFIFFCLILIKIVLDVKEKK